MQTSTDIKASDTYKASMEASCKNLHGIQSRNKELEEGERISHAVGIQPGLQLKC